MNDNVEVPTPYQPQPVEERSFATDVAASVVGGAVVVGAQAVVAKITTPTPKDPPAPRGPDDILP